MTGRSRPSIVSDFIGEVNRMKAATPVLNEEGPQKRIFMSDDRVVCLLRRRMRGSDWSVSFLNSDHDERGDRAHPEPGPRT